MISKRNIIKVAVSLFLPAIGRAQSNQVRPPISRLDWVLSLCQIYKNPLNDEFVCEVNLESIIDESNRDSIFKNTSSYVSQDGNDNNSGSFSAPYKTIQRAIDSNCEKIFVMSGVYDAFELRKTTAERVVSKKICGLGDVAIRSPSKYKYFNWNRFRNSVYISTVNTAVHRVLDSSRRDRHGNFIQLKRRLAMASVFNLRDSYYYDSNTKELFINILNTAPAALHSRIEVITAAKIYVYGAEVYFKNLKFFGCYISAMAHTLGGDAKIYMEDCNLSFSPTHAVLLEGGFSFCKNVKIYSSYGDGFNYNKSNSNNCYGVEIACQVYDSGSVNSELPRVAPNLNGSSAHPYANVFRINGRYENTYGPGLADTQYSCTWNIACIISNGLSRVGNNYGIVATGVEATVYVDSCTIQNFENSIFAWDGKLFYRTGLIPYVNPGVWGSGEIKIY